MGFGAKRVEGGCTVLEALCTFYRRRLSGRFWGGGWVALVVI